MSQTTNTNTGLLWLAPSVVVGIALVAALPPMNRANLTVERPAPIAPAAAPVSSTDGPAHVEAAAPDDGSARVEAAGPVESEPSSPAGEERCLVMPNELAKPHIKTEYQGKTYRFCCLECIPRFEAEPEYYLSRAAFDGAPVGDGPRQCD